MTTSKYLLNVEHTITHLSLENALENPPARIAELGWAAGFVDGEGCISAVRQKYNNPKYKGIRLRLHVGQNDLASLQRLQEILGVKSYINPVKWNATQTRPIYQLNVDGRHALEALYMLEPFLFRKKHQARACFELWENGRMAERPGRKGVAPEVWEIREYYLKRLQRMK
jgi:hypothetical protein